MENNKNSKNKKGEEGNKQEQKKVGKTRTSQARAFISKLLMPGGFWSKILNAFLIFLIIVTIFSMVADSRNEKENISLSTVSKDIKQEKVESINVSKEELTIKYKVGEEKKSRKEAGTALSESLVNYGISVEKLSQIDIEVKGPNSFKRWFAALAPFLIPILFLVFLFWFISKQAKGASMQAFSFGQSKARLTSPDDESQKVTFKDVAGSEEAKEELSEVVDFLKRPKKFLGIGAKIPKGTILIGSPGTGKTLLARAVAGEAEVPFYSISGSEFVEMFVGVGASRVRDLFKQVKKSAPSIIFIDELDAIGRVRGTGTGGGHDEREQTLNQILVEMDGFEPTEKVVILAATNRPDVLDPALLRPGRFDRRVITDLPDRKDREAILKIHSDKKPFTKDVDLSVVAERTPGFSGADLYSLMNESAILAARNNRKKISQSDLISSIEKVMLGPERKSHILSKKEKDIAAYHEVGHALLASILPYADLVHKVSIIARGKASGYTLKLPFEDKKMQSRKEFLDDIVVSLGGYVAEKIVFDDITTGASNDLQVLSSLARDMVSKYGMSEKIGPVSFDAETGKIVKGQIVEGRDYSEKITSEIDEEVNRIIKEAYEKTERLLIENRKVLDGIAKKLVEVETIERPLFEDLLREYGITPKGKEEGEKNKKA